MHTNTRLATASNTTAAQRRRRHLSVYHRALRSAETPEQRAAVADRYRQLFAMDAPGTRTSLTLASSQGEVAAESQNLTVTVAA